MCAVTQSLKMKCRQLKLAFSLNCESEKPSYFKHLHLKFLNHNLFHAQKNYDK